MLGSYVISLYSALEDIKPLLGGFEDTLFGHYTLTRYFLAYAVSEILKSDPSGKRLYSNFKKVISEGKQDAFLAMFAELASTTEDDINAEVGELVELGNFDYKRDLKNAQWCRVMCGKVKAAYNKDVKRKKATRIAELVNPLLE